MLVWILRSPLRTVRDRNYVAWGRRLTEEDASWLLSADCCELFSDMISCLLLIHPGCVVWIKSFYYRSISTLKLCETFQRFFSTCFVILCLVKFPVCHSFHCNVISHVLCLNVGQSAAENSPRQIHFFSSWSNGAKVPQPTSLSLGTTIWETLSSPHWIPVSYTVVLIAGFYLIPCSREEKTTALHHPY